MKRDSEHRTVASGGSALAPRVPGTGPPVIVIPGSLRTDADYAALAAALAARYEVHILKRRGPGGGRDPRTAYRLEDDRDDVLALLDDIGATRIFGHSYGGLIALEAARRARDLSHVAVYEPGVALDAHGLSEWLPEYRRRLGAGDARGAFAILVRHSGHAPAVLRTMPLAYTKLVLRLAVRGGEWQHLRPLLAPALAEHEQVARFAGGLGRYRTITARVLIQHGSRTPAPMVRPLTELARQLPNGLLESMPRLAHHAPERTAPHQVADRLGHFFET